MSVTLLENHKGVLHSDGLSNSETGRRDEWSWTESEQNPITEPALQHLGCRYTIALRGVRPAQCRRIRRRRRTEHVKGGPSQQGRWEWTCESRRHREGTTLSLLLPVPHLPSTLSRLDVGEDKQHPALRGKPGAGEEHVCLLAASADVKCFSLNRWDEAGSAHRWVLHHAHRDLLMEL